MAYDFSAMNTRLTETFGELCTHTPLIGTPESVRMIPHDPGQTSDPIPGVFAVLEAPTSSFSTAPSEGDTITYRTKAYKVFGHPQDIGGMTRLALVESV